MPENYAGIRGVAQAPKQLGAAFEQCKHSPLGKHSFVMYEMDPPPGKIMNHVAPKFQPFFGHTERYPLDRRRENWQAKPP